MKHLRTLLPVILCGSVALLSQRSSAATFTWGGLTGDWATPGSWVGGTVPPANLTTTDLAFGGDVSTGIWVSNNNIGTGSFQVNRLIFQGIDAANTTSGLSDTIQGNTLQFIGADQEIRQQGSANIVVNNPIQFSGSLLFSGNGDLAVPARGAGTVTLNGGVSGVGDITKTGTSTFRFGTVPTGITLTPSANTWVGNLFIQDGTVRFNNNAQAASSALRSNPVTFTGNGTLSTRRNDQDESDGVSTSLRMGTLNGSTGAVDATVTGTNVSNYDIVVTALTSGTYGGSINIPAPLGTGNDGGKFVLRGPGTQTLTGNLTLWKDSVVGHGSTLVLAGAASFQNGNNPNSGAVTLAGGTLKLDNTTIAANRLRDGNAASTTMETIGGGMVQLIGNPSATTSELTGRLQLGSGSKPRSGHLMLEVVPSTGTGPATQLTFQSYSRDQSSVMQLATVEFAAVQGSAFIGLGGAAGKIFLTTDTTNFPVRMQNTLISTTPNTSPQSIGWATVDGPAGPNFASYDNTLGVVAATTTNWAAATPPVATTNARVAVSVSTAGTGGAFPVNSIRMAPASSGAALTIAGADVLTTTAFLLAGGVDYAIQASGTGTIGGAGPRFFHVQTANLTVDAPLTGSAYPVVKSGDGTLTLTRNNSALNQIVAINQGGLRATPGTTLPQGELRLRGGQLEIQGGTFSRTVGTGANTVNWSGVDISTGTPKEVEEDRGSGGFAAFGADASVDLNGAGPNLLSWEDMGFLRSGYALVLGSNRATNRVTWTDNLSLSAADLNVVNYNAREIRVLNNVATTGDSARISGSISGRVTNDLLKTGAGDLELIGANTYAGATIVQEGRLFVNGNSSSSFLHRVMSGATLAGKGPVGNVLVESGGILAPGVTDGVASYFDTKDLQFTDAASKLSMQLGGNTPGGDGIIGYDQLRVIGTVKLNGADLEGTFLNNYLAGVSDIFFLILNDGADAVVGQFADGSQITIGLQTFSISYTADSGTNSFTGGNDVALQLIPEPGSFALLGLGSLLIARRRRASK